MANRQHVIQELIDIVGEQFVIYAPEDLIVFEYDGSTEKGFPQVVAVPSTADEVSQIVKLARRENLPVVPRGSATSISGGAIAARGGILLALTRMNRVLEVDPENMIAVVEPGLFNLDLSTEVSKYDLYYAPDPSSQKVCTIGGNVAENAGGPHCLAYGVTTNHVLGLEVVLSDGTIMWVGGKHRDVPGYDLPGVIVGSEGTFAVATKVIVRLMRKPESTRTLLAVYDDIQEAVNSVSAIIGNGIVPAALEMIDNLVIQAVEPVIQAGYPLDADAVLLIEVEGLNEAVEEDARAIQQLCKENNATDVQLASDQRHREKLWAGRKGAFGSLGRFAPNYYILDGVVPRSKLPEVMKRVLEIGKEYDLTIANVFHAGDGNLHPIIIYDEREPGKKEKVMEAGGEVMKACVKAGGSLTGEHGIGLEKQRFMRWVFTEEDLDAMRKLRAAFSPEGIFNPGKIFPDEARPEESWRLPSLANVGTDMPV